MGDGTIKVGPPLKRKAFIRLRDPTYHEQGGPPQVKPGKKGTSNPHPVIEPLECKGCMRCVIACPAHALKAGARLNERGYRYVEYSGAGCTGCGACYHTCPEPNALEVHIPLKEKGKDD